MESKVILIKLEQLKKSGVNLMLWTIVCAFVVAVVLAALDSTVRLTSKTLKSVPCTPEIITECYGNSTGKVIYTFEINDLSAPNKYVYSIGKLTSFRNEKIDIDIDYIVDVYGRGTTEDPWKLQSTEDTSRRISCEQEGELCLNHLLFLFEPIESKFLRFDITFDGPVFDDYGLGEYKVYWQKASYTVTEFSFLIIYFVCGSTLLVAYIRSVKIDHNDTHPEQRWIAFIVLACIFMNRINEIPSIILGATSWEVLSTFSNTLSNSIFMTIFLIIIDELKHPGLERSFRFFFYKVIFGIITFGLAFTSYLLRIYYVPNGVSLTSYFDDDHTIPRDEDMFRLYVGFSIALSTMYCVWGVWFLHKIRRLKQFLKGQLFIITRFRQLSFRLLLIMGFFVTVYFVTLLGVSSEQYEFGLEEDRPLSSLLLYSTYILILGYVYLPADSLQLSNLTFGLVSHKFEGKVKAVASDPGSPLFKHKDFYIQTAKNLAWISLKVYFEPEENSEDFQRDEPCDFETLAGLSNVQYSFKEKLVDATTDTHVYIFMTGDRIVVAFRGTNSVTNAKTDANVFRCNWEPSLRSNRLRRRNGRLGLTTDVGLLTQGIMQTVNPMKVHEGFFTSYRTVRETLISKVEKYIEFVRKSSPRCVVLVTGHSLGGALATFAALDIAQAFPYEASVLMYNYGSPRVGNHSFAEFYNKIVPNSYRICNDQDIVTALPKFIFFFKHIGKEIIVDIHGNLLLEITSFEKFLQTKNSLQNHRIHQYFNSLCLNLEAVLSQGAKDKHHKTLTELTQDDLVTLLGIRVEQSVVLKATTQDDTLSHTVYRLSQTTEADEDINDRLAELSVHESSDLKSPFYARQQTANHQDFPVFGKTDDLVFAPSLSSPVIIDDGGSEVLSPPVRTRPPPTSSHAIMPQSHVTSYQLRQPHSNILATEDRLCYHKYEDEDVLLRSLGVAPEQEDKNTHVVRRYGKRLMTSMTDFLF